MDELATSSPIELILFRLIPALTSGDVRLGRDVDGGGIFARRAGGAGQAALPALPCLVGAYCCFLALSLSIAREPLRILVMP